MTNEFQGRIAKIVTLLEDVVGHKLDPRLALLQWPDIETETDKLLTACWHDLSHFAADEDVCDKDAGYATYQRDLLLDRIRQIKAAYNVVDVRP